MVGLILGTLGRQGSVGVLERVEQLFRAHDVDTFVLLLSEITREKLALFTTVDAWVQVPKRRRPAFFFCSITVFSIDSAIVWDSIPGHVVEVVFLEFPSNWVHKWVGGWFVQIACPRLSRDGGHLFRFGAFDKWVGGCCFQIACPRLSLDWGHLFDKPLLSSYEAYAVFEDRPVLGPMDYYSNQVHFFSFWVRE